MLQALLRNILEVKPSRVKSNNEGEVQFRGGGDQGQNDLITKVKQAEAN